jgi:hypothetical protein
MQDTKRSDAAIMKGVVAGGVIASLATATAFFLRDKQNREKIMKGARETVKTIKDNPALAGTVGAVIGKVGEMGAEKMKDDQSTESKADGVLRRGRPAATV